MNRRSPLVRLLALLCLAALVSAQACGVARGYQCDCTGRMEWTVQDHCHGPHHADCHRDDAPGHAHGESDGAGERRDHAQVREDVQSLRFQSLATPAMAPILVAVWSKEAVWPAQIFRALPVAEADVGAGPPRSVAVARTVVLLI